MKTILKVVCSWCGKDMGKKDGKGQIGVSHTICPDCAKKFEQGFGKSQPDTITVFTRPRGSGMSMSLVVEAAKRFKPVKYWGEYKNGG